MFLLVNEEIISGINKKCKNKNQFSVLLSLLLIKWWIWFEYWACPRNAGVGDTWLGKKILGVSLYLTIHKAFQKCDICFVYNVNVLVLFIFVVVLLLFEWKRNPKRILVCPKFPPYFWKKEQFLVRRLNLSKDEQLQEKSSRKPSFVRRKSFSSWNGKK